jgi:hypothetical protein
MRNKFKLLVLLFSFSVLISSCKKETIDKEKDKEQVADCEKYKYGNIRITNTSSNPYDIYIDNSYKLRLLGNRTSGEINISEGNNRKLYAKQVSGYVLYPTEREASFNVVRCSNYTWSIP